MANGKEIKFKETPNKDPIWSGPTSATEVTSRLSLPEELKSYLKEQGMDFRFLNSMQLRTSGGYHHSDWRPFDVRGATSLKGKTFGANAEGVIMRGDLVLGIRPKTISAGHRERLNKKNKAYSQANVLKTHAKQVKEQIRDTGLGEHVAVDDRDDSGSDD